MNCPLCDSSDCQLQAKNYQGYVENTAFDIFLCNNCLTSFVDPSVIDPSIYDQIYSENGDGGYQRYYDYAKKVKQESNPMQFLAKEETTYLPLFEYLSKQTVKLDILEVGCGYGYTVYAVSKLGHNVQGIDISKSAVDFATKEFGHLYKALDVKDLPDTQKYDLIYANEVIEHLSDTQGFMKSLKRLLKPGGVIHLTTPNKDYATKVNPKAIWITILPPHHMLWGSRKGLSDIAKLHGFDVEFFDFGNSFGKNENRLNEVRRLNNENKPAPMVVANKPVETLLPSHKKLIAKLLYLPFVQLLTTNYLTQVQGYKDYKTNSVFLRLADK